MISPKRRVCESEWQVELRVRRAREVRRHSKDTRFAQRPHSVGDHVLSGSRGNGPGKGGPGARGQTSLMQAHHGRHWNGGRGAELEFSETTSPKRFPAAGRGRSRHPRYSFLFPSSSPPLPLDGARGGECGHPCVFSKTMARSRFPTVG